MQTDIDVACSLSGVCFVLRTAEVYRGIPPVHPFLPALSPSIARGLLHNLYSLAIDELNYVQARNLLRLCVYSICNDEGITKDKTIWQVLLVKKPSGANLKNLKVDIESWYLAFKLPDTGIVLGEVTEESGFQLYQLRATGAELVSLRSRSYDPDIYFKSVVFGLLDYETFKEELYKLLEHTILSNHEYWSKTLYTSYTLHKTSQPPTQGKEERDKSGELFTTEAHESLAEALVSLITNPEYGITPEVLKDEITRASLVCKIKPRAYSAIVFAIKYYSIYYGKTIVRPVSKPSPISKAIAIDFKF